MRNVKYLLVGIYFGTVLTKSEAISWLRIQEMFRFQSFHMYGIIMSAIATAMIGVLLLKLFKIKTAEGTTLDIPKKEFRFKAYLFGGTIFGLGWAVTGACPGPLYALLGAGNLVIVVTLFGALLGTLLYSVLRSRLPH